MAFDEVFTLSVKFIRLPNGFAVTIRSSETVGMLKSVIYNRIKVEPDYQTLVYAGLILHDKLNLVYYGITDRSNVYLVIKPSKSVDNLLLKSSKSVENINNMIDIEMIRSRSFKDKYQSKTIQNQCTLIYRDLFYDRQENRRNGLLKVAKNFNELSQANEENMMKKSQSMTIIGKPLKEPATEPLPLILFDEYSDT